MSTHRINNLGSIKPCTRYHTIKYYRHKRKTPKWEHCGKEREVLTPQPTYLIFELSLLALFIRMMFCNNCFRHGIFTVVVEREEIKYKKRKTYFNIKMDNETTYTLCIPCKTYILENNNEWEQYWPAFIWRLLNETSLSNFYESRSLSDRWKFIPKSWRFRWICSLEEISRETLSIDLPPPSVEDVTNDLQ